LYLLEIRHCTSSVANGGVCGVANFRGVSVT
jgi:hypothetical protein